MKINEKMISKFNNIKIPSVVGGTGVGTPIKHEVIEEEIPEEVLEEGNIYNQQGVS